jgi:tetratricopeptide (TPR) repeat protein
MRGQHLIRWGSLVLVAALSALAAPRQAAFAQEERWYAHIKAGNEAEKAGRYDEAEKWYLLAVESAEDFVPPDTKLAANLPHPVSLYDLRPRPSPASPVYKHPLATREKPLGPDRLGAAARLEKPASTTRENHATLLKAMDRTTEAGELLKRAAAIRERRKDHP